LYGATTTADVTSSTTAASKANFTFYTGCTACYCCCRKGPNTGKEWVPKSKGNS
jgi:hypothetical protein